jgi:glycerol uptake facilitator-like aquaporin
MEWSLGRILLRSVIEFALTTALLFGIVTIVRFVIGESPISRAVPDTHGELFIVGLLVAVLLAALIASPAGRISGGHMNPAISVALWRFGVFPRTAVIPYIVAQLLGSFFGVELAARVLGKAATLPPTLYAVIQPGPGWTALPLFLGEAISMAAIVLVVGFMLSRPRLSSLLPLAVGAMIGLAIALLGTSTGGSVNPARQFGPAIVSGELRFLWVYLTAPIVGALIAAIIRDSVFRAPRARTYDLSGRIDT